MAGACAVDGCGRTGELVRGWCRLHYQRWLRRGSPDAGRRNTLDRFWEKVDTSGDCWIWTACLNAGGYGHFTLRHGVQVRAHRLAYELLVGPIPEGLTLDHLCRNRPCVNPAHLEPVTLGENTRRGSAALVLSAKAAARTHCKHGHSLAEPNGRRDDRGRWICRECKRNEWRRRTGRKVA